MIRVNNSGEKFESLTFCVINSCENLTFCLGNPNFSDLFSTKAIDYTVDLK